jgi:hypothetical protein
MRIAYLNRLFAKNKLSVLICEKLFEYRSRHDRQNNHDDVCPRSCPQFTPRSPQHSATCTYLAHASIELAGPWLDDGLQAIDNNRIRLRPPPSTNMMPQQPRAKRQRDITTLDEFYLLTKKVQRQSGQRILASTTEDRRFCDFFGVGVHRLDSHPRE